MSDRKLRKTVAALDGMSRVEPSPIVLEVARPVSDEAPCGTEVTYHVDFEALRREVGKHSRVSTSIDHDLAVSRMADLQGKSRGEQIAIATAKRTRGADRGDSGTNHKKVVALSRRILKGHSKDLRVAAYLATSLTGLNGAAGVLEGIAAVSVLCQIHWNDLFPKQRGSSTGRRNALDWFLKRQRDALAGIRPDAQEIGDLEAAIEIARGLEAHFAKVAAPDLSKLMSGLILELSTTVQRGRGVLAAEASRKGDGSAEQTGDTPSSKPRKSAGMPEDTITATPAPATRPAPVTPPVGSAGSPASARDVRKTLIEAVHTLRGLDPANPVPYRLLRTLRWGSLGVGLDEATDETQVPAPRPQVRTQLEALLRSQAWTALVDQSEHACAASPLWLDAQWFAFQGLEGAGDRFKEVRTGLIAEINRLIARHPNLPDLRFNDGTPFLSDTTRPWLLSLVSADTPTNRREPVPSGGTARDFSESDRLFRQGDLKGAMRCLQLAMQQQTTERERFEWRLRMSQLALDGGEPLLALRLLEALDETITAHRLDHWEPSLALRTWSQMQRCYELMKKKAKRTDRSEFVTGAERTLAKISRVDPVRVIGQ